MDKESFCLQNHVRGNDVMKKKKFVSALALTLALVCAFTLGANAAGTLQEIKAYLNSGITIKLDGTEQVLKDANGTRIFPITYNGSIYLPVRAISDMLGVGVDWDQATQSVLLGKQASGVDLIDTYEIYHKATVGDQTYVGQTRTADGKTENIAGVTQTHWIYAFVNWYGNATFSYNLLGKHDTLTFSYYSNEDAVLKLTGDDDTVLGEYTITGGAVPKTVTLPLVKTSELKFNLEPIKDKGGRGITNPQVRIFDAYLDAEQ